MIHEEICSYEVCKLAKEKGFPQRGIDSNKYWFENFKGIVEEVKDNVFLYEIYPESRLARQTTQSLLQRWLIEEKGVHITVSPNMENSFEFDYIVYTKGDKFWNPIYTALSDFATFELALEDGIKYALENLV